MVRRLFKRGTIDIYETSRIEVGYSGFGATIGIMCTLRARDRDMFIQWAKLSLLNNKDGSRREFSWSAFRTPKISVGMNTGQSAEVALDAPFSFLVSSLEPYRFNTIFSDDTLIAAARPVVEAVRKDWLVCVQKLELSGAILDPGSQQALMKKLRRAFDLFSATPGYQDALERLKALYYWAPGSYQLTLEIQTARPNRTHKKSWPFTLLDDVNGLENNVYAILEEVCGLPLTAGGYIFASASYGS
jgi:hypothetical protein